MRTISLRNRTPNVYVENKLRRLHEFCNSRRKREKDSGGPDYKKKPPFRYILKLFVYRKAYKSVDSENLNAIGAFQIFFTTHVFI